jgi:hypothetical protein
VLLTLASVVCVRFVRATYERASDMPGVSFTGEPLPLPPEGARVAEVLEARVRFLCDEIGPRSSDDPEARARTLEWLEEILGEAGTSPFREVYDDGEAGERTNLVLRFEAADPDAPVVVFSAHYDTVPGSPGADDDASGVAVLLQLAAALALEPPAPLHHTLELVFFDGEEAGWDRMGSRFHAQALLESGAIVSLAVSLEMLGYYSSEPGSQDFPAPFLGDWYPEAGDFLAFVGNRSSEAAIHDVIGRFRGVAEVPSEGLAAPDSIEDVGRSDHAQFWEHGWPGLMITDTADFRNAGYHTEDDVVETLDFVRLARISAALDDVLRGLVAGQ